MTRYTFQSPFQLGDKVIVDGDPSLIAKVIQVAFRSDIADCEISWVHQGDIKRAWVDNWRLTPASS